MSDTTQGSATAPSADEAGDGGANIDSQAADDSQSLEGADVEVSDSGNRADDPGQALGKSAAKQADGDFPIMS